MNWAEFYFKITTIGQLVGFAFLIIARYEYERIR